jgi:hypothetical protein
MSWTVNIFQGNGPAITPVEVTENSYVNRNVMGECTAYIEFFTDEPVSIAHGDYCVLLGDQYFIKDQVIPTREVNRLKYQLTLYGTVHELEKVVYFISDSTGEGITADVSWSCTPLEFLNQLIVNLIRVHTLVPWNAGSCLSAPAKTITLKNNNCLEALQAAAELFGTHWEVKHHTIRLNKLVNENLLTLEVGKNKGLREITANKGSDSKLITRLYAYGSDQNSPTGQPLAIDPIDQPGAIEVIEAIEVFDDIFPQFLLAVTLVVHTGPYSNVLLTNPTGFNIPDYIIQGQTPQLTFLSGECNGLTFTLAWTDYMGEIGYVPLPRALPDGTVIPGSPGYEIFPGDKFEIWNVTMPDYFMDEARLRLQEAAEAYLNDHQMKTKLNLFCDEIYFRRNMLSLSLHDRLNVISDIVLQLASPGVEVEVIGYKKRIVKPWLYDSLTVGDVVLKETGSSTMTQIIEKIILKTIETGVDDKHFVHAQQTSSAEWFVTHALGKKPAVSLLNFDGSTKDGQIVFLSPNTLKVLFSVPGTGYAICN